MSSRRNPFEEVEEFFEAMSRRFDEASENWDGGSLDRLTSVTDPTAVDLVERDDEYVATVDLPGFERENVDVRITDRTLRIEAERSDETEATGADDEGRYIRRERSHESVERSIRLPEEVDTDGVTARMNHGVLTVTMPRIAGDDEREIEIDIE